jgi:hypothetical protein
MMNREKNTMLQSLQHSVLNVFDIDDTLVYSSAKVLVKDSADRTVAALSTSEYNTYSLPDGCRFDYSEFRSADIFCRTTKPIANMIRTINAAQATSKKNPKNKTVINTARADFDDREKFLGALSSHGIENMDKIHVHRSGNLPGNDSAAKKKLVYIREYLNAHPYTCVRMYDDSMDNLNAFLSLRDEYPNVRFCAYHVGHGGKMSKYDRR